MAIGRELAFQHARQTGTDERLHVVALARKRVAVEQFRKALSGDVAAEAAQKRAACKPALEIFAIVHRFIKDEMTEQRRKRAGRNILAHDEAALLGAFQPGIVKMTGVVMGRFAHHREIFLEFRGGTVDFGPNQA